METTTRQGLEALPYSEVWGCDVEFVAHRAGNDPDLALRAARVADLVDLDVHWHWGRLEVRHLRVEADRDHPRGDPARVGHQGL